MLNVDSHRKQEEREAPSHVTEDRLLSLVTTVLDTIVDGVITIDEYGIIRSYNRACAKLFGYSAEEVLGKNITVLMPPSFRPEHDGYLAHYRATREAKIIGVGREVLGQRKDGTVFPIEIAIGATDKGGEHRFVGIIRDITEQREAAMAHEQLRQSQKMDALGQLTGGIAHDFNNMLAVILGNLDLLKEKMGEEHPLQKYVIPSIAAAEHGAELTRQLLAFGRKQALQPQVISVNTLLKYFAVFVKHLLGERIAVMVLPGTDIGNVYVDPNQLQNVLLNLAVNARDAMPGGGHLIFETKNIQLDAEYARQNTEVIPGEYVMIAVTDSGEGMSSEIAERVFEPFFSTKEVGKGTGLGLSMVYGFIKQSRGHIKIYSEVGQGTSIKMYLPRTDAVITPDEPNPHPILAKKLSARILIVEDNPEVLKLTSSMVESLGYDVISAYTGDQAMLLLETRDDIDLLLTDVMLPGTLNGPAMAKRAVALHPGLKVIFNSGYAEQAMMQSGLLEKNVHLIGKPFRKEQLAAKIAEVLNG